MVDGVTVADTTRAVLVHETHLPSCLYIPRADFRDGVLRRGDLRTFCPFKGTATHWSVNLPGRTLENSAWSYERPLEIAVPIGGYVAFYDGVVDQWIGPSAVLERIAQKDEPPEEAPLTDWLSRHAWLAPSASELTEQLAHAVARLDDGLMMLQVGIWTLHPQLVGTTYTWRRGCERIEVSHTPRGALQEEAYLKSPERFVSEGLGGVRQRLNAADPEFQFPVMQALRDAGGTDYVAMPLPFSDGQVHTLSLTSDDPGGFSVSLLGQVFEAVPVLSRMYEVHTTRANTRVLLDTYLGPRTGERVLNGLTQRGDGENINAVIWFCDLRSSTELADALPREAFLEQLNQFFDGVAGAVLDHGGEVLRFIGDAVLAIFPIPESSGPSSAGNVTQICYTAIEAVHEAERRIAAVNQARQETQQPTIRFGVGLHVGEVTYGNIGTADRLEFTVIGAAANEAARIEGLCKSVGKSVLISDEFARFFPESLQSVGRFPLRGVEGEREIFTL